MPIRYRSRTHCRNHRNTAILWDGPYDFIVKVIRGKPQVPHRSYRRSYRRGNSDSVSLRPDSVPLANFREVPSSYCSSSETGSFIFRLLVPEEPAVHHCTRLPQRIRLHLRTVLPQKNRQSLSSYCSSSEEPTISSSDWSLENSRPSRLRTVLLQKNLQASYCSSSGETVPVS